MILKQSTFSKIGPFTAWILYTQELRGRKVGDSEVVGLPETMGRGVSDLSGGMRGNQQLLPLFFDHLSKRTRTSDEDGHGTGSKESNRRDLGSERRYGRVMCLIVV